MDFLCFFCILSCFQLSYQLSRYVDIRNGILKFTGYNVCTFENDGDVRTVNNTGDGIVIVNNYYYGLIKFTCDEESGHIISSPECKTCGLYCTENDLIDGCQNSYIKSFFGLVAGAFTFMMLGYFLRNTIGEVIYKIGHWIIAKIQHAIDRREDVRVRNLNRRSDFVFKPHYRRPIPHDPSYKDIVLKKRAAKPVEIPSVNIFETASCSSTAPLPKQEVKEKTEKQKEIERLDKEINEIANKLKGVDKSKNSFGRNLAAGLILSTMTGIGEACDMNYYMNSLGKICNTHTCHDVNMFTFPISYGNQICFQDGDSVTKFKIEDSYDINRYSKEYLACSYSIHTKSYWACEGTENCNKDACRIGTKHGSFVNVTGINIYSCETGSSPCTSYCYWGSHCTYRHISAQHK